MYSDPVPTAFGSYLLKRLHGPPKRSQRDFARDVNTGHSTISQVISGVATPPLEKLALWAEKLRVPPEEMQYFSDLAALGHLPDEARERIERIYLEHVAQGELLVEVSRQVAELKNELVEPRPGRPAGRRS